MEHRQWTRTLDIQKDWPSCICGQQNVRATARGTTKQHKGHTPSPRIKIKIINPAGNRTRVAGLGGRDSTDHATTTDLPSSFHTNLYPSSLIIFYSLSFSYQSGILYNIFFGNLSLSCKKIPIFLYPLKDI